MKLRTVEIPCQFCNDTVDWSMGFFHLSFWLQANFLLVQGCHLSVGLCPLPQLSSEDLSIQVDRCTHRSQAHMMLHYHSYRTTHNLDHNDQTCTCADSASRVFLQDMCMFLCLRHTHAFLCRHSLRTHTPSCSAPPSNQVDRLSGSGLHCNLVCRYTVL